MKKTFLFLMLAFTCLNAHAQSDKRYQNEDDRQRGYYDRPYLRYEAEEGKVHSCAGTFITAYDYDQRKLASEASNQQAIQLVAQGDYVAWENDSAADGLNIRFSLPDCMDDGKGTKGTISLYVNDDFVQDIELDSYWAWQWQRISNPGRNYADNMPDSNFPNGSFSKFARMRFDEVHLKLECKIPANAVIKLVKKDNNTTPYTIDFVELEEVPAPVRFEDIEDANKVAYDPVNEERTLPQFIFANRGKTIYIPAGNHIIDNTIYIAASNTKVVGAGMWYTNIYLSASVEAQRHGIAVPDYYDTEKKCIEISGIYLNKNNNKRYRDNTNANTHTGWGLTIMGNGSADVSNVVIRDVWLEHFECGAMIELVNGIHIAHSRFRNNYADGINLCRGTNNTLVEHCSFRNNGDDDMAIWARDNVQCTNNTFRYNTAENNWRAASVGFHGGKRNTAHHLLITDGLDAGFRITADFPGAPFSDECYSEMHNISVYGGGTKGNTRGVDGGYMGELFGALHISASSNFDIKNFRIYDVDLNQSKNDAVYIGSGAREFSDVSLANIVIQDADRYGIRFSNAKGDITYCNLSFNNCASDNIYNLPVSNFNWTEAGICNDYTTAKTCGGLSELPIPNDCDLTMETVSSRIFPTINNCNVTVITGTASNRISPIPPTESSCDISNSIVSPKQADFKAYSENGDLIIVGMNLHSATVFDTTGRIRNKISENMNSFVISGLPQGIYIVRLNNSNQVLKVAVK